MSEVELYREKYEAKLDEWEASIIKLKAKSRQEKSNTLIQLQHKVDELQVKHAHLKEKLNDLSDDKEKNLGDIKSEIEKAGSDLAGSIKAAAHKLKKD